MPKWYCRPTVYEMNTSGFTQPLQWHSLFTRGSNRSKHPRKSWTHLPVASVTKKVGCDTGVNRILLLKWQMYTSALFLTHKPPLSDSLIRHCGGLSHRHLVQRLIILQDGKRECALLNCFLNDCASDQQTDWFIDWFIYIVGYMECVCSSKILLCHYLLPPFDSLYIRFSSDAVEGTSGSIESNQNLKSVQDWRHGLHFIIDQLLW